MNVISCNINIDMPLYITLKLLSARPHMITAWRYYIRIGYNMYTCGLPDIYILGPVALRLRVYTSGKPLIPIVKLLGAYYLVVYILSYKNYYSIHISYIHFDMCNCITENFQNQFF